MNQLIAIANRPVGPESIPTVNARDLHAFLAVGKDFSNWIKAQVERARLVENRDFVLLAFLGEQTGRGGHNKTDYFLTVDAAKHVAMMSGTDKGFEVRDYFIECERLAKTPLIETPEMQMARGLLAAAAMIDDKNRQIAVLEPKAAALDRIATADGSLCITNAAKDLQVRPKDLFAFLSGHKWIYRRAGGGGFVAYQDRLQSGLLEHKVTIVTRSDGSEKLTEQVLVTAKGMTRLAEALAVTA